MAIEARQHSKKRVVDRANDPDFGPSTVGGAADDDACDGKNASAAGAAKRDEAREAVGAERGADEPWCHAKRGGLADETRVLKLLVKLFEGPLKGNEAIAARPSAFGAEGGAPDLVERPNPALGAEVGALDGGFKRV